MKFYISAENRTVLFFNTIDQPMFCPIGIDNIFDSREAVKMDLDKNGSQMYEASDGKFYSIKSLYDMLKEKLDG